MQIKIDKETSEVVQNGKKWERFVQSEEWQMVKDKILEKIISLTDVTTLDENQKLEGLLMDVKTNKRTVLLLKELIDDVEGEAQQFSINKSSVSEIRRNEIITRYSV